MGKNRKNRSGVVYSTNDDYDYKYDELEEAETLEPNQQKLYVLLDRKNRKGKEATLVQGFVGNTEDLKALAKLLKTKCGVGGNVVEDDILIQGDKRDKVIEILQSMNYNVKRKGG